MRATAAFSLSGRDARAKNGPQIAPESERSKTANSFMAMAKKQKAVEMKENITKQMELEEAQEAAEEAAAAAKKAQNANKSTSSGSASSSSSNPKKKDSDSDIDVPDPVVTRPKSSQDNPMDEYERKVQAGKEGKHKMANEPGPPLTVVKNQNQKKGSNLKEGDHKMADSNSNKVAPESGDGEEEGIVIAQDDDNINIVPEDAEYTYFLPGVRGFVFKDENGKLRAEIIETWVRIMVNRPKLLFLTTTTLIVLLFVYCKLTLAGPWSLNAPHGFVSDAVDVPLPDLRPLRISGGFHTTIGAFAYNLFSALFARDFGGLLAAFDFRMPSVSVNSEFLLGKPLVYKWHRSPGWNPFWAGSVSPGGEHFYEYTSPASENNRLYDAVKAAHATVDKPLTAAADAAESFVNGLHNLRPLNGRNTLTLVMYNAKKNRLESIASQKMLNALKDIEDLLLNDEGTGGSGYSKVCRRNATTSSDGQYVLNSAAATKKYAFTSSYDDNAYAFDAHSLFSRRNVSKLAHNYETDAETTVANKGCLPQWMVYTDLYTAVKEHMPTSSNSVELLNSLLMLYEAAPEVYDNRDVWDNSSAYMDVSEMRAQVAQEASVNAGAGEQVVDVSFGLDSHSSSSASSSVDADYLRRLHFRQLTDRNTSVNARYHKYNTKYAKVMATKLSYASDNLNLRSGWASLSDGSKAKLFKSYALSDAQKTWAGSQYASGTRVGQLNMGGGARGLSHMLEEQRTGKFLEEYYEKVEEKLIEEKLKPDFWNSAFYGIYGMSFRNFEGNDADASNELVLSGSGPEMSQLKHAMADFDVVGMTWGKFLTDLGYSFSCLLMFFLSMFFLLAIRRSLCLTTYLLHNHIIIISTPRNSISLTSVRRSYHLHLIKSSFTLPAKH